MIASFMPWADLPHGEATGWSGSITVLNVTTPNWLVSLSAIGLAALGFPSTRHAIRSPTLVRITLASYGLAHASYLIYLIIASERATVGIGVLFTIAAFGVMAMALQREWAYASALRSTTRSTTRRAT